MTDKGRPNEANRDDETPGENPAGYREAQDRPKQSGQARSPVDSMHVDSPPKKEGHK